MASMKLDKNKNPKKIYLADKFICNFISEELFDSNLSIREVGRIHGIHQHVVSKINQKNGYRIPFSTIVTICFNRGIELPRFFKLLEKKYGQKLDDSFIEE